MSEKAIFKEQIAICLKDSLKKFASSNTEQREAQLPQLTLFIKKNVNESVLKELIGIDSEFNQKLTSAVELTIQTPFDVKGKPVNPWTGEHTIVALDSDGYVVGACCNPTKALKSYGDLHPYALTKALFSLHLYKADREEGLENEDNLDYISSIAHKEVLIFTGAPKKPLFMPDEKSYYLGSSGCAVKKNYLKELLGGATPAPDTQAGRFDGIFAEMTQFYMADNASESKKMPEPTAVREMRRNN